MDYSKFREIDVTDGKLDFWFTKSKNVMLFGKHGVGKSSVIMDTFERNGLVKNTSYKMFSGGTLDPWTDFIGIPKKTTNASGEDILDYIRPDYMNDNLEAIFMDEYNRSPKAVRNALMELIQFKSINGRSFPNLKLVWAACNPDIDDSYDVDEIDPAQGDRFQIIVNIPYKPNPKYFTSKYGSDISNQAITWWKNQPESAKELVSPRRLDYAIEYLKEGGDVSDILPINSDVTTFKSSIIAFPSLQELYKNIDSKNWDVVKSILNDDSNVDEFSTTVFLDKDYFEYLGLYLNEERLTILSETNDNFFKWCVNNSSLNNRVRGVLKDIYLSIENYDNISKTRLDIYKNLFDNGEKIEDIFLIANFGFSKLFLTDHSIGSCISQSDMTISITAFIRAVRDPSKSIVDTSKLHWDRLIPKIPNIQSLNKQNCILFLTYVNELFRICTKNTEYKGIIRYVNAVIAHCSNMGYFSEDLYFNIMKDFRKAIKESSELTSKFIIKESDMINIGDVCINTTTKKSDSKILVYGQN